MNKEQKQAETLWLNSARDYNVLREGKLSTIMLVNERVFKQAISEAQIPAADAEPGARWTWRDASVLPDDSIGWCLGMVKEVNDLGISHYPWMVQYSKIHGWTNGEESFKITHWMPVPRFDESAPPPTGLPDQKAIEIIRKVAGIVNIFELGDIMNEADRYLASLTTPATGEKNERI